MRKLNYIISVILSISIIWCSSVGLAQETMEGIDVSKYQGSIDFSQVRNSGIAAVYIRAGEGDDGIDPYFEQNYTQAKEAQLKIGFYHYVTARSVSQAQSQAVFFYSLIRDKQMDCYPVMDFESFGNLDREQTNQIALAYLETLENLLKIKPAVYSNTSNAVSVWGEALTEYPLWIARYGADSPGDIGPWNDWAGFQYTDQGIVEGVAGEVDRNLFRESILIKKDNHTDGSNETGGENNGGEAESAGRIVYVIKRGDTLSEIALKFGTTTNAIARLNGIQNVHLIYAGERLFIPAAGDSPEKRYTVQRGDTLSEIARRFSTTVAALERKNNITNPNLIYPGQRLYL